MAAKIGDTTDKANVFKEIRKRIEAKFDFIIQKATERRDALIEQLVEWEREYGDVIGGLEVLKSSKHEMEQVYETLTFETARGSLKKSIDELTAQISETNKKVFNISFVCETSDFELRLSQLGVLSKTQMKEIIVRDYKSIHKPLISFGKLGKEIRDPRGILVDESNSRIFVTDHNNRIQVWSMDGKYQSEFGMNILKWPWEIVLHENFLYISDFETHFITKWCCGTFSLIASSKTTPGSIPGQLYQPAGLDINYGEVCVVEYENKRVSVFDLELCFKRVMAVGMLKNSFCLRVRSNTIYIVEITGVIKLFSKAGQLLRTIDKNKAFFNYVVHFNFDSSLYFLLTDMRKNSLCVVSPDGELIHSICFKTWGVREPFGIDVTCGGNLVVGFQAGKSAVVIL